jgi:hypothetical protein
MDKEDVRPLFLYGRVYFLLLATLLVTMAFLRIVLGARSFLHLGLDVISKEKELSLEEQELESPLKVVILVDTALASIFTMLIPAGGVEFTFPVGPGVGEFPFPVGPV